MKVYAVIGTDHELRGVFYSRMDAEEEARRLTEEVKFYVFETETDSLETGKRSS